MENTNSPVFSNGELGYGGRKTWDGNGWLRAIYEDLGCHPWFYLSIGLHLLKGILLFASIWTSGHSQCGEKTWKPSSSIWVWMYITSPIVRIWKPSLIVGLQHSHAISSPSLFCCHMESPEPRVPEPACTSGPQPAARSQNSVVYLDPVLTKLSFYLLPLS